MNPANVSDLEARWRPLSDAEKTVAGSLLTDAWELLLTRRPSLETDMASGVVRDGNVRRVVTSMVLRVLRNPDGLLQETIDDYSYRRDSLVSSGALHVTADEMSDVTPAAARRSSVRLVTPGNPA